MSNWKNIFKSWAGIPVLILAALVVVWFFVTVAPRITFAFKAWQAQRAYNKMWEPYYKDTYGGKTPEETYDLFIAALKKGDTDFASKYFEVKDQDDWKKTLNKYKESQNLNDFVTELENNKKMWKKNRVTDENTISFSYEVVIKENTQTDFQGQKVIIPAGSYSNVTEFHKNQNGIWKIYAL